MKLNFKKDKASEKPQWIASAENGCRYLIKLNSSGYWAYHINQDGISTYVGHHAKKLWQCEERAKEHLEKLLNPPEEKPKFRSNMPLECVRQQYKD